MNKSILWLIGLPVCYFPAIGSCSETNRTRRFHMQTGKSVIGVYYSIATVAEANRGNGEGQWKIIRSYKLPSLGLNETGKIIDNVTVRFRKSGRWY